MRCALLCGIKRKDTNAPPSDMERCHQRNWLRNLVFSCLRTAPLEPQSNHYYQKYAPNLGVYPRAGKPKWLQETEQPRVKNADKQANKLEEKQTTQMPSKEELKKKNLRQEYSLIHPFIKRKSVGEIPEISEKISTEFGIYSHKKENVTNTPRQRHSPQMMPPKYDVDQITTEEYSINTERKRKLMEQERALIMQFTGVRKNKRASNENLKSIKTDIGTYSTLDSTFLPKYSKTFAKLLHGVDPKTPEVHNILKSRYGMERSKEPQYESHKGKGIEKKVTQFAPVIGSSSREWHVKTGVTELSSILKAKDSPYTEPRKLPSRVKRKERLLSVRKKKDLIATKPRNLPSRVKRKEGLLPAPETKDQSNFPDNFGEMSQDVNPKLSEQLPAMEKHDYTRVKADTSPKFTSTFAEMLKNVNVKMPEKHRLLRSSHILRGIRQKHEKEYKDQYSDVSSKSRILISRKIKAKYSNPIKRNRSKSLDSFEQWVDKYEMAKRGGDYNRISPIPSANQLPTKSEKSFGSIISSRFSITSHKSIVSGDYHFNAEGKNTYDIRVHKPIKIPGDTQFVFDGKKNQMSFNSFLNVLRSGRISHSMPKSRMSSKRSRSINRGKSSSFGIEEHRQETSDTKTTKLSRISPLASMLELTSSYSDIVGNAKKSTYLNDRRAFLAAEIARLMPLVDVREDPTKKKPVRNFVLEAQTRSWPTKRPQTETIKLKKSNKFPTKLEKIQIAGVGPLAPKSFVIRRYCKRPQIQPPIHQEECGCKTCGFFGLGAVKADTALIREMKCRLLRTQLMNYYRLLKQREALQCKFPAQSLNQCRLQLESCGLSCP